MIPKNVYFIWFGDNIPDYVFYAKHNFEYINPGYSFKLINFNLSQINDMILINTSNNFSSVAGLTNEELILDKSIKYMIDESPSNPYYYFIFKSHKTNQLSKFQMLIDLYRTVYIDTFGGIYMDCDTFPVSPFDDRLVKNEIFYNGSNDKIITRRTFFFGKSINRKSGNIAYTQPIWYKNSDMVRLRDKLIKCKLQIGESPLDPNIYYIDHFHTYEWDPSKKNDANIILLDDQVEYRKMIQEYQLVRNRIS